MGRKLAVTSGILAGLVALALTAPPIASGWYASQDIRATLARLSDYHPGWQWQLEHLDRGLFTSTAQVRQRPAGGQGGGLPWQVTIHHGPTVGNLNWLRVEAVPRLPDPARQAVNSLFQGQSPLTVTYRRALDGRQYLGLHSPAVKRGGAPFTWQGLEATADLGKEAERLRLNAEVPALQAGAGPNRVGLQGLAMEAELNRIRPYVWVGWSKLDLDSFQVQSVNPDTGARFSFDLAGLTMESQSRPEAGRVHSNGQWQVSSVFINATPYRALEARWTVRDLDAEALQHVNELTMGMQPAAPGTPPAEAMARLTERLGQLPIEQFLASEPTFELKTVTISTREGKLTGSGRLRFLPLDSGPATLAALQRRSRARLRLTMPEPVFQRVIRSFTRIHASRLVAQYDRFQPADLDWMAEALARRRVHELRQAGLVDSADGQVTISARWDGRDVTINGRPVADLQAALGSRPAPGQLGR